MKVIKRKSKTMHKAKNGKEYPYINYYLEFDNGLRVAIRTFDVKDIAKLDAVAIYEK